MTVQVKSVVSSRSLLGSEVSNDTGETLGRIEDFVIDLSRGRVAYAVLSFSQFLGLSHKFFAVPVAALELSYTNRHFILNVEKEKLKEAPGFDRHDWPEEADSEWLSEVYRYYGYGPLTG